MSKLVVRVVKESRESQVCVFEHSIQDNSVILQNDPKLIHDEIEELEAAVSYLKNIRGDNTTSVIVVNGRKVEVMGTTLPYKKLCRLAGLDENSIVTVAFAARHTQGTVIKGHSGPIEDGVIYNINVA